MRREKIFEEMFSGPLSMSVINEESVDQISETTVNMGKDNSTTERTKDTQKEDVMHEQSCSKK